MKFTSIRDSFNEKNLIDCKNLELENEAFGYHTRNFDLSFKDAEKM